MLRAKIEPVYQAEADDEALDDHTEDDQCDVAHLVYRPCSLCGTTPTTWTPYMEGYWCNECRTCFDMNPVVVLP